MKNLRKMVLKLALLQVLLSISPTLADEPIRHSNDLKAQVEVSRDAIRGLLTEFESRIAPARNYPDYETKIVKFKAEVDAILAEFDRVLREEILHPLSTVIERYNEIATSRSYSEEQKDLTLGALRKQLNLDRSKVEDRYWNALLEVLKPMGFIPTDANGSFYSRLIDYFTLDFNRWVIAQRVETYRKLDATSEVFQTVLYPKLSEGCVSLPCVTLFTGDLSLFLQKTKEGLHRDLKITLADGTEFKISGTTDSVKLQMDRGIHMLNLQAYPESFYQLQY
jgi:hypothetical protein